MSLKGQAPNQTGKKMAGKMRGKKGKRGWGILLYFGGGAVLA